MEKWINAWVMDWFRTDIEAVEGAMEICEQEYLEYHKWTATSKREIAELLNNSWLEYIYGNDTFIPTGSPLNDLLTELTEEINWEQLAKFFMDQYVEFFQS